jgi:hypothetical protein
MRWIHETPAPQNFGTESFVSGSFVLHAWVTWHKLVSLRSPILQSSNSMVTPQSVESPRAFLQMLTYDVPVQSWHRDQATNMGLPFIGSNFQIVTVVWPALGSVWINQISSIDFHNTPKRHNPFFLFVMALLPRARHMMKQSRVDFQGVVFKVWFSRFLVGAHVSAGQRQGSRHLSRCPRPRGALRVFWEGTRFPSKGLQSYHEAYRGWFWHLL